VSVLSAAYGGALRGLVAGGGAVLSSPWHRATNYSGNSLIPNLLPEPGELWQLYTRERITNADLGLALKAHGINWNLSDEKWVWPGKAWQAIFQESGQWPTSDEIFRLKARGLIDDETELIWWARAGYTNPKSVAMQRALRAPLIDLYTLFQLRNRQLISPTRFANGLRELGWDADDLLGPVAQLRFFVPPFSDIPRFMLRDVFDERVVEQFGMDAEFNEKFTGRLQDWAQWQGITPEVMLAYWRAHWATIAPTQLYEMLHRLRPGVVDPAIATTVADAQRALAVNDVLPFWRDRLIAISYRLLTRVDIRRMYNSNALNKQQVESAYLDLGYQPKDAKFQTDFADQEKQKYLNGLAGLMKPAEALKLYTAYELSEAAVRDVYVRNRVPGAEIDQALKDAQRRRDAKIKRSCLAATRKRYLTGLWDPGEAVAILQLRGYEQADAIRILDGWQCELSARGKVVSGSQLCQWFERGLIDAVEFATRLVRVGYSGVDADRAVAWCALKVSDKRIRAAQAAAQREERARNSAAKDAERRARQAVKDVEARIKLETDLGFKSQDQALQAAESAAKVELLSAQAKKATAEAAKIEASAACPDPG